MRAQPEEERDQARRQELEAELRSAVFVAEKLGFSVEEALEVYRGLFTERDGQDGKVES